MPFADYSDFDDCVSKNKDKNNPQAYCGTVKSKVEGGAPLAEAFRAAEELDKQLGIEKLRAKRVTGPRSSWGVPFTVEKLAEMTRITGDAIHPVKTDNKILYRLRELILGARTLTRSPIILNHIESQQDAVTFLKNWGNHPRLDPRVRKVIQAIASGKRGVEGGHVNYADWSDESQSVKYLGSVHDSDYESLLGAGLVHSVSIGARPLLGFEDESQLIPAGIVFEDLSLLTEPLRPADPQASIKVMEAWFPHGSKMAKLRNDDMPGMNERDQPGGKKATVEPNSGMSTEVAGEGVQPMPGGEGTDEIYDPDEAAKATAAEQSGMQGPSSYEQPSQVPQVFRQPTQMGTEGVDGQQPPFSPKGDEEYQSIPPLTVKVKPWVLPVWKQKSAEFDKAVQELDHIVVEQEKKQMNEKLEAQTRTTGQNTGIEANPTALDNRNTRQDTAGVGGASANVAPQFQTGRVDSVPQNESRQALSSQGGGGGTFGQSPDIEGTKTSVGKMIPHGQGGQMDGTTQWFLYASKMMDAMGKLVTVVGDLNMRIRKMEASRGVASPQGRVGPDLPRKLSTAEGVSPEDALAGVLKQTSPNEEIVPPSSQTALGKILEKQSGRRPKKYGSGY